MYVCLCRDLCIRVWVAVESRRESDPLELSGGCELPDMGTGNESLQCLSRLSSLAV